MLFLILVFFINDKTNVHTRGKEADWFDGPHPDPGQTDVGLQVLVLPGLGHLVVKVERGRVPHTVGQQNNPRAVVNAVCLLNQCLHFLVQLFKFIFENTGTCIYIISQLSCLSDNSISINTKPKSMVRLFIQ